MSANPLPTPPKKTTTLRTNPLSRREYSSSSSSSSPIEGTIGQGAAGIPADKIALTAPSHLDAAEKDIFDVLNRELEPDKLEVKDVSGGCGSMYAIEVTSERFRGLGMLKQQRLVNGVLGERVKGWHGVQMKTGVP
ncbi:bola-like protein [Mollisia scopiformis]|uniref:Bola-like protein n=1 Tax=Mollisia scopiformis TaxID=149040 RepID=A0A194XHI4_MOLSC|nr:bola-like protein [Mollisia scopiformis]KUJ19237.1 bola-like protein [Mollisia scopiformis]